MSLSSLRSRLTIVALFTASFAFPAAAQVQTNYASDVFLGGQEGPSGTSNYRIPGMTVAPDGSLLARLKKKLLQIHASVMADGHDWHLK